MLIACAECHRQYDAGNLTPGAKLRCRCGAVATVPASEPRTVQVLCCSNCGGRLREASSSCEYCGAALHPLEDFLGDPCPKCFARLLEGARFCGHCATEIAPESVLKALTELDCPRCEGTLVAVDADTESYYTCSSCASIWLDRDVFDRLLASHEARAEPIDAVQAFRSSSARTSKPQPPPPPQERSCRCPSCKRILKRINFGSISSIYIDRCMAHGFWFDADELDEVMRFVEAGGLDKARKHVKSARRRKRLRARRAARERAHSDSLVLDLAEIFLR